MLCDTMERLHRVANFRQVTWNKPIEGKIKLNTDGSFIKDNGKAGIGRVVRYSLGDVLMAFSLPIQCTTNNQAEALAAKFGTSWWIQNGLDRIHIELDSMVVANMPIKKRYQ